MLAHGEKKTWAAQEMELPQGCGSSERWHLLPFKQHLHDCMIPMVLGDFSFLGRYCGGSPLSIDDSTPFDTTWITMIIPIAYSENAW